MSADFHAFWQAYPRRVAKLDAIKAYAKARKLASAEEILDGVERYKQHKPEYADWAHPASWLNKGRWLDEWAEPEKPVKEFWGDECQRLHGGACINHWTHCWKMKEEQTA